MYIKKSFQVKVLLSPQVCKRNVESSPGAGQWERKGPSMGGNWGKMEGSGIWNLSRIQTRG